MLRVCKYQSEFQIKMYRLGVFFLCMCSCLLVQDVVQAQQEALFLDDDSNVLHKETVTPSPPWPPLGYACYRVNQSIQIDGVIDQQWDQIAWTSDFVDIEGSRRAKPRFRTRAKMAWDEQYFYIAAELQEPHLWATLTERDSIIFYDNDFELFFDPDGDTHLYGEFEINAFNTVWDLLLVKPYQNHGPAIHEWDMPGLKTAVALDGTLNDPSDIDRGWTIEIAVPWEAIKRISATASPPKVGDRWRVNYSRVQWQTEINPEGETGHPSAYRKTKGPNGERIPEDNWVWTPMRRIDMHEPEYWGIVAFCETLKTGEVEQPVQPTELDFAAWKLRTVYRQARQIYRRQGQYPTQIELIGPDVDGPSGWSWPPDLYGNGQSIDLSIRRESDGLVLLIPEDGQLHQIQSIPESDEQSP